MNVILTYNPRAAQKANFWLCLKQHLWSTGLRLFQTFVTHLALHVHSRAIQHLWGLELAIVQLPELSWWCLHIVSFNTNPIVVLL